MNQARIEGRAEAEAAAAERSTAALAHERAEHDKQVRISFSICVNRLAALACFCKVMQSDRQKLSVLHHCGMLARTLLSRCASCCAREALGCTA